MDAFYASGTSLPFEAGPDVDRSVTLIGGRVLLRLRALRSYAVVECAPTCTT